MNPIKLVCLDLDHTLITHSSWKELGLALGISQEEDRRLYNEHKAGKISYKEWNAITCNLYKKSNHANKKDITDILSGYSYRDGTREMVTYLKNKGYILVLISGSIDILVEMVAKDLGITYAQANNTFVFDTTGTLERIDSGDSEELGKLVHLQNFCRELGISITECACIADGGNDIEMFRATGRGITFADSPIKHEAWKVIDTFADIPTVL